MAKNDTNEVNNSENEKVNKNIEEKDNVVVKEESNNKNLIVILVIVVAAILLILGVINMLGKNGNTNNIKSVKRVLKAKYVDVECIDSYCNGLVAIKGDKLSKYTVELYNAEGKKVASYKEKYSSASKSTKTPYQMTDSYFITRIMNNENVKDVKYSINNKKGKELYSTNNRLTVLNDNFVLMEKNDKYTILDIKGKELYSDISDIDTFYDDKYISFKIDDTYTILDEKGDKVLNNYKIAKEVKTVDDKTAYFVVKDIKESVYYYYDVNKNKIIGDSFESYRTSENDGELIITKQVNDSKEKYILSKDGKQEKQEEVDLTEVKEKVNSDAYFLYSTSVMKKDQKNVIVDNKAQKSLGILNLESDKFTPLYSYKSDKSYFYSTVSKIGNSDDMYLKITCSEYSCDTYKTIVFNMKNSKEIYRIEDENLVVSDYSLYESGYNVVKYSSSTKNEKYKNKYVLYDKNNKELYVSSNRIVLIDKKLEFGNDVKSSLTLYSAKDKKALNEESSASIITISNNKLYKYTDKNDNVIICDEDGKTIINTKKDNLKYSSTNIIYLEDEKLYIYDASKNKMNKYKLKNNEKINDSTGSIIAPYRGSVFVNNSTDKYIKVLNSKANVIKKIKGVELSEVKSNPKTGNVFIITKGTNKTGNVYGLYIAK